MDHLWAGWRSAYVSGATETPGPTDCVLCNVIDPRLDDAAALVLHRGPTCTAVLNAFPYTSGHLMVMPTRHVGKLADLTADESTELWETTRVATAALESAYQPGGINIGANLGKSAGAGVPGHLHMHALPRWDGDTNFMTTLADVRVLPETLTDSWAKLRAAWPHDARPR